VTTTFRNVFFVVKERRMMREEEEEAATPDKRSVDFVDAIRKRASDL
jgi:hypothetical protein|tara:strand:- start:917 stop:1057 length:141 start_codon:yes stop_codon:yes gene_type:complete